MTQTSHQSQTRTYLLVFAALAGLTALTVGVSYMDFSRANAIAVASLIAAIKVSLIAAFFMHLKFENRLIHGIFFTALILIGVLVVMVLPDVGFR